jgi:hypothetical protein
MALNTLPRFANGIRTGVVDVDTAATLVTVCTGGSDGSVIESLGCVSDDTSAQNLEIWIVDDSANEFLIGTIEIPITAGTDGTTPAVNVLNTTDMPFLTKNAHGMPILNLEKDYILKVAATALTALKQFTVYCAIRDYSV